MTTASNSAVSSLRYHQDAYQFVFQALRYTQQELRRIRETADTDDEDTHISGQELLEGIRQMALEQFGLMTRTVFKNWGIRSTEDFGRIVFEMVERGEMRKTDRDQLSDFFELYDFDDVFDRDYRIDTRNAFQRH